MLRFRSLHCDARQVRLIRALNAPRLRLRYFALVFLWIKRH
nr:MAG TPA: hypothetical protein [Caudoviricetes sp.]